MKYSVEILGETYEVDVREAAAGLEVAVGDGPYEAARLSGGSPTRVLDIAGHRRHLTVVPDPHEPGTYAVAALGARAVPVIAIDALTKATALAGGAAAGRGPKVTRAAMPGVIAEVRVEAGQTVAKGDVLLILEAMKMQNEISAPGDAVVEEVFVTAGEAVAGGAKLVAFGDPA